MSRQYRIGRPRETPGLRGPDPRRSYERAARNDGASGDRPLMPRGLTRCA
jgi:hypothetical protein